MHSFGTIHPKLKKFILVGCTLFLFTGLFKSLTPFLGLSLMAFEQKFLWQFFTYLFVHPPFDPLGFYTILPFALHTYLLWMFGSEIVIRKGIYSFFTLYLGAAFFSGLTSIMMMILLKNFTILTGFTMTSYALMIGWVMLNPFSKLLLFFTLPFKAYQLVFGGLALHLFIEYSNGHVINATAGLAAAIFSYLFAIIVWKTHSPFAKLHNFESNLIYFSRKAYLFFQNTYVKIFKRKQKI